MVFYINIFNCLLAHLSVEASLAQTEVVQARLAQNELDLKREISALHEELKRDQDPGRMQLIQETISVGLTASM
jgi:hypothetical protein